MVNIFRASILLTAAIGCNPTASNGGKSTSAGPTSIATDFPKQKDLRRTIEQPATIEAFEETPLVARIAGDIGKVSADIDQRVKVNEVLAELSVPDKLQELEQKKALVLQAKAEAEQAAAA